MYTNGGVLPATGGMTLGLGFLTDPTSAFFWLGLFALICVAGAIWRAIPRNEGE